DPTGTKEQVTTVVFLGRLVAMKQPEHALEAYRALTGSFPEARLGLIGDAPQLDGLQREAPSGASFLARLGRDELQERLARAHVLVATSVREGWGLNVSEAAACGTPSIGYAVPGLVDSIRSSGGVVVDPHPQALCRALAGFFEGSLSLLPRFSEVPWPDVSEEV